MAYKFCKFASVVKMSNGKKKCRCKRDGHIVNNCSAKCPHVWPTLRARLAVWKWKRSHK